MISKLLSLMYFHIFFSFVFPIVILSLESSTTTATCDCDNLKANYEYLLEDHKSLYNTSLNLYQECTNSLDNYKELYDNELDINDMCLDKFEEYERINENLTNSINYTKHISLLKQNIQLESDLYLLRTNLTEKLNRCEEKHKVSYVLISDLNNEIANLKSNFSDLVHEVYQLDGDLKECRKNLEKQTVEQSKTFANLKSCVEREENLLESSNKYVNRLATCRKNNKKLKGKNSNLTSSNSNN